MKSTIEGLEALTPVELMLAICAAGAVSSETELKMTPRVTQVFEAVLAGLVQESSRRGLDNSLALAEIAKMRQKVAAIQLLKNGAKPVDINTAGTSVVQ